MIVFKGKKRGEEKYYPNGCKRDSAQIFKKTNRLNNILNSSEDYEDYEIQPYAVEQISSEEMQSTRHEVVFLVKDTVLNQFVNHNKCASGNSLETTKATISRSIVSVMNKKSSYLFFNRDRSYKDLEVVICHLVPLPAD